MARYTYNFEIVGNLEITNGIMSGFSPTAYGTLPQASANLDGANWEFGICITTGSNVTTNQEIIAPFSDQRGTRIEITSDSKFGFLNGSNGSWINLSNYKSSYTVLPNTTYYLKASYSGNTYSLSYSLDNDTYTTIVSYNSSTTITSNSYYIGMLGFIDNNRFPFLGSIDLTKTYIKLYNVTTWEAVNVLPDYNSTHIQLRHDTVSNWESVNPVLLDGEVGIAKEAGANVNITGTLPYSNGILSGFSSSNYAQLPSAITLGDNFELCIKTTTGSDVSSNQKILSGRNEFYFALGIYSGNFDFNIGNGTYGNWINPTLTLSTLSPNTTYWFKITFSNSRYSCSYSTNGEAFTECAYKESTVIIPTFLLGLGVGTEESSNTQYYLGNIDLSESYLNINNVRVWNGISITPKLKIGDGTTAWNDLPYII